MEHYLREHAVLFLLLGAWQDTEAQAGLNDAAPSGFSHDDGSPRRAFSPA
jgi:hypothetical protein